MFALLIGKIWFICILNILLRLFIYALGERKAQIGSGVDDCSDKKQQRELNNMELHIEFLFGKNYV